MTAFLLALCGFLVLLVGMLAFVARRLAVRCLQFDEIFEKIGPVLTGYSIDLNRMTGQGLLLDHPEVKSFHHRNMAAVQEISEIVKEVTSGRPPKASEPQGKRPVVE